MRIAVADAFGLGWFLNDGRFIRNGSATTENELRLNVGTAWRLSEGLQISAATSVVATYRSYPEESAFAGMLGDTSLALRYDFDEHPEWAVLAQAIFPTGRTLAESRAALGTDVTSRGGFAGLLGAAYETLHGPWFLLLQGTIELDGPLRGADVDSTVSFFLGASTGRVFASGAAFSVGAQAMIGPALSHAGVDLPDSARRRTTVFASAGVPLNGTFTLALSSTLDPPLSQLGKNQQAQLGVALGLRVLLRP